MHAPSYFRKELALSHTHWQSSVQPIWLVNEIQTEFGDKIDSKILARKAQDGILFYLEVMLHLRFALTHLVWHHLPEPLNIDRCLFINPIKLSCPVLMNPFCK